MLVFYLQKYWCNLLVLVAALCWFMPASQAQQASQSERELQQLQRQIQQTERQVRQQQRQLQQAEQRLQEADKALADAANQVRSSTARKARLQQESENLSQQQQRLEQQLQLQQQLLAAQLRSAYSLGQHDYSRLILNQQDTARLERVLTYYQYFNQARLRQLADINQTASELQSIQQRLAQQQQQITTELTALTRQQQQLTTARASQQESINNLQQLLQQQGNQLSYLRQNETSLQNTINELRRLAERNRDLTGLTAGRGNYPWPLRGRVLQRFGQSRQAGLASRGILIQGINGANVQSIASGRVIYADWLKGYGWVIVVDHGKGFMSLYGHNQSLLKQPGDNVERGEAIAQVGASGGQAEPGLYFEIRERGEAVNPLNWLGSQ